MAADFDVEADRTDRVPSLAVDNLHAADAVLYYHNPPDVAAVHTVPEGPRHQGRRTAVVEDNHPVAAHRDRVAEVVHHIAAVVEEHRRIAAVDSLTRRSGRSSLVVGVELRRSSAGAGSRRRRSCHSSRWRTL